jgi:hypothetical protein
MITGRFNVLPVLTFSITKKNLISGQSPLLILIINTNYEV